MPAPAVRHSLVIHHPRRPSILLTHDGDEATLPVIVTDDRHTAEVDHINAAVRATFGLTTTVLRSLYHDDRPEADPIERCHELIVHGADAVPGVPMCWCDLASLSSSAPRVWHRLAALGVPVASDDVPADGRAWERAGWWAEVTAWIDRVLRERAGRAVTHIEQLRVWPSSCVLRVHAGSELFYFKAVPRSLRRECGVTAYLAREFPQIAPAVVLADSERGWLLMRAARGRKLEEIEDVAQWERAARLYASLQMGTRTHTDAFRASGCRERSVAQLAHQLDRLTAWVDGCDSSFDAAERARWRQIVPLLRQRCDELVAHAIPLMLDHGDLWPGNFLVDAATCVLIDWEEAVLALPFFSLAPLLVGLETYQPRLATAATVDRIVSAYLEPFASLALPARLRTAVDSALPLAFCDMALRYQQQRSSMVRLHPWMRDLVPETLRRALTAAEV